ncbi:hypothetical protein PSTT_11495, partial [Puccinia striiformis]
MMVEGLSATVNSFQCPDPVKAQAMCSRTDGDTTVVEKPYPDGLGYYCSSNIKDASQNCCNLDLKIALNHAACLVQSTCYHRHKLTSRIVGHVSRNLQDSPNEFLVPKLRCGGAHMVLQRNVSLNHLNRAQNLVYPEEMQHNIDFDCTFPSETFSQWTQLLLPCGLAGPVKNCCNTDFKIRLFRCLRSGLGGGLARRIVKPEAKPNEWPATSKSISQLRFLVTMVPSASSPPSPPPMVFAPVPLTFRSIFSSVTRHKIISYLSLLPPAFVTQDLAHITKLLCAVRRCGASAISVVVPSGRTQPGPMQCASMLNCYPNLLHHVRCCPLSSGFPYFPKRKLPTQRGVMLAVISGRVWKSQGVDNFGFHRG